MQIILIGLLFCAFLCLYRVARGPTPADRIVATDFLGIILVGFTSLFALLFKKGFIIDIALSLALLSFIATLAFAKYLEGRNLDD